MAHSESDRYGSLLRNRFCQQFILLLLLTTLISPMCAADKGKDGETLKNPAKVLTEMLNGKNVPADVLAAVDRAIVLPNAKKFGLGIGGTDGRGPMSCRRGKNFTSSWSSRAMYSIGGASLGLQVGGSSTDFILLVMSQKGVDAVLKGKTKLGNEATAAGGPSGATHVGTVGGADVLAYGRASGLFAGTSLGGATLAPDDDANERLYGRAVTAEGIIFESGAVPTRGGHQLVSLFNVKVPKHET
jgi:SH3 domain-containing YSC84-like protein 1